jgi:hypothetical protein
MVKPILWRKVRVAWNDAKKRCYCTSSAFYHDYGGRGIKVGDNFVDDFECFYTYVSSLPNFGLNSALDRVDNDAGYILGNIRWATPSEQVQNRRKMKNNTSGNTGVTWYYNKSGGTRAIAWWEVDGETKSKSFPEKKFGLIPAYAAAVAYRAKMIAHLNANGACYTVKHGK